MNYIFCVVTCPDFYIYAGAKIIGYEDRTIFANGTFVNGSTSELSADGPLREPYAVYCQGGTHWTHWAFALQNVVNKT